MSQPYQKVPPQNHSPHYPQNREPVKINADAFAAEAIRTARPLNIGSIWNRTYSLVVSDYWNFFLAVFLAMLCMQIIVLNYIVMGGLFYYCIGRVRNQRREIGDLFIGFDQMTVPLILAGLITSILQVIGFLFLILPGIYLVLIWWFVYELVIDKHLNFWDAMEVSRKVVHHHFGSVLLLFLCSGLMISVGLLACFIGVYFVMPFSFVFAAVAYEDLFGGMNPPSTNQPNPPCDELSF